VSSDESKSGWPTWLTVAIIILAILLVMFCVIAIVCAGMFYFAKARVTEQAEAAMTKAQIAQIEAAVEYYQLMVGEYPTTDAGIAAIAEKV